MTLANVIIGLVLLLVIIIVLNQLTKVGDLLSGLTSDEDKNEENKSGIIATIFAIVGVVGTILLVYSYFAVEDRFLPVAASELGRDFTKFFQIYSIPILIIFFVTHALLFFFAYRYRYKTGRKIFYFPESNKLELIWTSIPLIVVVILGLSTMGKWIQATSKPSEDALHIKVTGMQFKWFIAYPGEDEQFGERDVMQYGELQNLLGLNPNDELGYDDKYAEEVVVPVNKEIAFEISALDVIHDFYLPHFRVKMDAIPGVPTRLKILPDKTTEEMREITGDPDFEYEIACAELCGSGHWNMRKVLRVVSQAEYETWLSEQMSAKELYYNTLLAAQEEENMNESEDSENHGEEHDNHDSEEQHDSDDDESHSETAAL